MLICMSAPHSGDREFDRQVQQILNERADSVTRHAEQAAEAERQAKIQRDAAGRIIPIAANLALEACRRGLRPQIRLYKAVKVTTETHRRFMSREVSHYEERISPVGEVVVGWLIAAYACGQYDELRPRPGTPGLALGTDGLLRSFRTVLPDPSTYNPWSVAPRKVHLDPALDGEAYVIDQILDSPERVLETRVWVEKMLINFAAALRD
jgi:hypothetical protein